MTCIKAVPRLSITLGEREIEQRPGEDHASNVSAILARHCSAVPPEYFWVMPVIMPLLALILVGVPVASILHRAGRSCWWLIIAVIPLLNLMGLSGVRLEPLAGH